MLFFDLADMLPWYAVYGLPKWLCQARTARGLQGILGTAAIALCCASMPAHTDVMHMCTLHVAPRVRVNDFSRVLCAREPLQLGSTPALAPRDGLRMAALARHMGT